MTQSYNGCNSPLKILNDIAAQIPDVYGFNIMFEDPSLNFYLCMDHTVQVMNPNNAIKNVMAKMIHDSFICVFIMDFNMKFYIKNTARTQLIILERYIYHGMALWFYILFASMLSLMYMR